MFESKFLVLEVASGTFQGNDWAKVKARSEEVAGNQIVSMKVDLKKVSLEELNKVLDKQVTFTLALSKGDKDSLVLKVVKLVA